jgi:hypothetical protein
MPAEEVRAALGEPEQIKPMKGHESEAVVWIYHFRVPGPVRQVQSGQIEYQRPNPLTGQMETLSEPVYSTEQTFIDQQVELLIFNGVLTEWKQSQRVERTFS